MRYPLAENERPLETYSQEAAAAAASQRRAAAAAAPLIENAAPSEAAQGIEGKAPTIEGSAPAEAPKAGEGKAPTIGGSAPTEAAPDEEPRGLEIPLTHRQAVARSLGLPVRDGAEQAAWEAERAAERARQDAAFAATLQQQQPKEGE